MDHRWVPLIPTPYTQSLYNLYYFFLSFTFTLPFFPQSENQREKNVTYTLHLRARVRVMERKGTRVSESRRDREKCKLQSPSNGYKKQYYSLFSIMDPLFCFCFDVTLNVVACGCGSSFPPTMWAQRGVLWNQKKITYIYIYIKSKISYKY